MKKIKIYILILSAFITSSCYDILGKSHIVPFEDYVGKWLFTGSVYSESVAFDSVGYITLFEDSTFTSDFSFFWDQDSSLSDLLIGKWYPRRTATYRDNYYIEFHIIIDDIEKAWRVHGGNSGGSMIWYSDVYGGEEEYYWELAD